MPLYRYHCNNCQQEFEVRQGFDDDDLKVCILCHKNGDVRRVLTPTGIIFKGKGFYVNDSKGKNPAAPGVNTNGHKHGEEAAAPVEKSEKATKAEPAAKAEPAPTPTPAPEKTSDSKAAAM